MSYERPAASDAHISRSSAEPPRLAAVGSVFAALLSAESVAAPTVDPSNVTEPRITGTTRVGQVLRTTPRHVDRDGADHVRVPLVPVRRARGARCVRLWSDLERRRQHVRLRQADAGFRIRSQVVARNAEGQDTATSNPTGVITAARPVNTTEPSISGTARVGSTLEANRGQWAGDQPITYSFAWLRCNEPGRQLQRDPGGERHELRGEGRRHRSDAPRPRDRAERSWLGIGDLEPDRWSGSNQPPPGTAIPVGELQAAGDRLVVATVQFSPNPVTSRTAPITARVRVTARGGRPVSGAAVFMRATPRVVQGQTAQTASDGWVTLTLVPNNQFPQPRSGFNVQFFIKASRPGDPGLGGIAGYRLVQVRLAG